MPVLTILTLNVPTNRSDDVVRYYEQARVLEVSGATSARLAVKAGDGGTLVVVATWPDRRAYQAWQDAPARMQFSDGIRDAAGANVTATSEVFDIAIDA